MVLDVDALTEDAQSLRLFVSPVSGRQYEGQAVGTSTLISDVTELNKAERIRSEFPTEGFGLYAVERLSDNELLGFVGLHRVTSSGELAGQIEIGWRLRRDAWGQGYATEAARACIAHAAKLGIPELISFTYVGNRRSLNVMKRLGMEYAGEFDHPALPEGHPLRRHALYRIRTEQ